LLWSPFVLTLACLTPAPQVTTRSSPAPDQNGIRAITLVSVIGRKGAGPGEFMHPQGLATDLEGNLYVADTGNDRIQKFDPTGQFIAQMGGFGRDKSQFNKPTDLCVNNNMEVWVVDSRNKRIQQFDVHLQFIRSYQPSDFNPAAETFGQLYGVGIAHEGDLYVTDPDNEQVYHFNPFGTQGQTFAAFGNGEGHVARPASLAFDRQGNLYICDSDGNRVAKFDPFGNYLTSIGESDLDGPMGVDVDDDGFCYVADTRHDRVAVFGPQGNLVTTLGAPGEGLASFREPYDVAIGRHDCLFVSDAGNGRVQMFRIVRR
jgi:DNA-binding beta-propeller fold protein YncE